MTPSVDLLSKEQIKERILQNIAKFWQVDTADIDSFDPILNLLVEVNANEAFRINHEIENSHARILKKLAKILTPNHLTGPAPAYSIMHAEPTDSYFQLKPEYQFYVPSASADSDKKSSDQQSNEIFFSPSGHFHLYDAQIIYLINSKTIYQNHEQHRFKTVINFKSSPGFNQHTLFLGIKLNREIEDLKGLSFFFEWKNRSDKNLFYDLLKQGTFSVNGIQIEIANSWTDGKNLTSSENRYNAVALLENFANTLFEKQLYFVGDIKKQINNLKEKYCLFPQEITGILNNQETQMFQEPLFWMEIKFPTLVQTLSPENLSIHLNCFPVINRKLNEIHYRLQQNFNIIPLITDEHFLDIKSVQDTAGYEYKLSTETSNDKGEGTYEIRESGVERFDSRNAGQHLTYLTELLRDESAAFTIYGRDFVSSLTRNFNQNIAELEQKLKLGGNQIKKIPPYLMLNSKNSGDHIFINYWSTSGEVANNLFSDTKLNPFRGAEIDPDSCYLIIHSTGGRNPMTEKEVLRSFKCALLSGDKIVSKADIKNFVWNELQDKIESVKVETGVAPAENSKEGLKKFIFIYLTPSEKNEFRNLEWDSINEDIKLKLESKSAVGYNYKIVTVQSQR